MMVMNHNMNHNLWLNAAAALLQSHLNVEKMLEVERFLPPPPPSRSRGFIAVKIVCKGKGLWWSSLWFKDHCHDEQIEA